MRFTLIKIDAWLTVEYSTDTHTQTHISNLLAFQFCIYSAQHDTWLASVSRLSFPFHLSLSLALSLYNCDKPRWLSTTEDSTLQARLVVDLCLCLCRPPCLCFCLPSLSLSVVPCWPADLLMWCIKNETVNSAAARITYVWSGTCNALIAVAMASVCPGLPGSWQHLGGDRGRQKGKLGANDCSGSATEM